MAETEKKPKVPAKKRVAKADALAKPASLKTGAHAADQSTKAVPAKKAAANKPPAKKTVIAGAASAVDAAAGAVSHAAVIKTPPSHAEIAHLAYIFWSQRGHHHGHDREDWLRAEEALSAQ